MHKVVRICIKIIFHLSKLWKANFSLLCDVIFLVRLQGNFDIDHSQEWKGLPRYMPVDAIRMMHCLCVLNMCFLVGWFCYQLPKSVCITLVSSFPISNFGFTQKMSVSSLPFSSFWSMICLVCGFCFWYLFLLKFSVQKCINTQRAATEVLLQKIICTNSHASDASACTVKNLPKKTQNMYSHFHMMNWKIFWLGHLLVLILLLNHMYWKNHPK